MTEVPAAVTLHGVKKAFPLGNGRTLDALNIEHWAVAAGRCTVLTGASGSGKTTLLNLIAGVSLPTAGTILVRDTDISALPEPRRDRFRAQHIGYVFQTFNLLPAFTALEDGTTLLVVSHEAAVLAAGDQVVDITAINRRSTAHTPWSADDDSRGRPEISAGAIGRERVDIPVRGTRCQPDHCQRAPQSRHPAGVHRGDDRLQPARRRQGQPDPARPERRLPDGRAHAEHLLQHLS